MHVFSKFANRHSISVLQEVPSLIEYNHGAPTTAYFPDGQCCSVECLGCTNPKCMRFDDHEIECREVEGFPNDKTLNVCPVDALSWNAELDIPTIATDKCIKCGICIRRCPVGALYFDGVVKVNSASSSKATKVTADKASIMLQAEQINALDGVAKSGVPVVESDELFESIYDKLLGISNNYHNPIGRNLLLALNCNAAMRRIGDVYTRMDALYSSEAGSFGAVEIEFGRDTLDASRGVLDDIAVLNTRYGINKHENNAVVIFLQLPNARQGYWQVVKDLSVVEHIKINTVTIGALMLLIWNGCVFAPENNLYYIDYDNMDLRSIISQQIGRDIAIRDKLLGILEPMK